MFLARKYTRAALSEIGRTVGRKSHSTVVSAQQKVTQWLATGKRVPLGRGDCSLEDALRRVEQHLRLG
jgi:chromosomal replication initiator protein